MVADLRATLLQQIHDNLDDDLARSVYADHLLERGGAEAWHGELIRLQLDHASGRISKAIRDGQTRTLGQLARLFDVTWTRGFPERLRTRKWTRDHLEQLASSKHLPTIRAIQIGFMRSNLLPPVLAKPAITSRITDLNVCSLTAPELIALCDAVERLPRLRCLGLGLEPMSDPADERLSRDDIAALFESRLGNQLEHVQKAIEISERDFWLPVLARAPRTIRQVDLLEVSEAGDARLATVYTRNAAGVLVQSDDELLPPIAILRADGDAGFESETYNWPLAQFDLVAAQLEREGLDAEAITVRAVGQRRRIREFPDRGD